MLVTVVSSDVSHNALSRALTMCELLARNFDVQLIGSRFGAEVWPPARGRAMEAVRGTWFPLYAVSMARLARRIRGEVVVAVKPLIPSFGAALLTRRPVILDIDDDELAFRPPGHLASSLLHPQGRTWTRLALALRPRAAAITVATTGLQRRFGGTLVRHARDTNRIRPLPDQRAAARHALGIRDDKPLVMFVGTPRPFKGLEDAAAAVRLMKHEATLVVAGDPPFPLDQTAFYLAAADAVVVPQRLTSATAMQLPAKLLDAMAAARPIVATDVADNAAILADGRGLIVPPAHPPALAQALDTILADPARAAAMGARARAWCVAHASVEALAEVVGRVVEGAAR